MLIRGQKRIEQEKVRTYHETGRLIDAHLQAVTPEGSSRAGRGKEVVIRLSKDLGVSETLLYRCVKFFQEFPKVAARPLNWSHYRALISLPEAAKRRQWMDRAVRESWPAGVLERKIKEGKTVYSETPDHPPAGSVFSVRSEPPPRYGTSKLLTPKLGTFYTCRIISPKTIGQPEDGALLIDLGFSIYKKLSAVTSREYAPGTVVEIHKEEESYAVRKSVRTEKDLFTYRGLVEKVIDGDTLKVLIDLGFDQWTRQVLRLRGLNCPEIQTPEGLAARRFVESRLRAAAPVILQSSRSDKYDRYLADIFLPAAKTADAGPGDYLNNLLLENRLAVNYEF